MTFPIFVPFLPMMDERHVFLKRLLFFKYTIGFWKGSILMSDLQNESFCRFSNLFFHNEISTFLLVYYF
jgi:hypothetical protein